MYKEKKEFSRSIRMTKTIKAYVEQAEGNGFNDKFERLVLKCKKEEPELDNRIVQKKEQLRKLEQNIRERQSVVMALDQLKRDINRYVDQIPSEPKPEKEPGLYLMVSGSRG